MKDETISIQLPTIEISSAMVLPRERAVHLKQGHDLTKRTIVTHTGKPVSHCSHTTVVKEKPGMNLAKRKVIKVLPGTDVHQVLAKRPNYSSPMSHTVTHELFDSCNDGCF